MRYLIQPGAKALVLNIVRNFLIMPKNLLQMHLKLLQKNVNPKNSRSDW